MKEKLTNKEHFAEVERRVAAIEANQKEFHRWGTEVQAWVNGVVKFLNRQLWWRP